jgi:hypothetical protein
VSLAPHPVLRDGVTSRTPRASSDNRSEKLPGNARGRCAVEYTHRSDWDEWVDLFREATDGRMGQLVVLVERSIPNEESDAERRCATVPDTGQYLKPRSR